RRRHRRAAGGVVDTHVVVGHQRAGDPRAGRGLVEEHAGGLRAFRPAPRGVALVLVAGRASDRGLRAGGHLDPVLGDVRRRPRTRDRRADDFHRRARTRHRRTVLLVAAERAVVHNRVPDLFAARRADAQRDTVLAALEFFDRRARAFDGDVVRLQLPASADEDRVQAVGARFERHLRLHRQAGERDRRARADRDLVSLVQRSFRFVGFRVAFRFGAGGRGGHRERGGAGAFGRGQLGLAGDHDLFGVGPGADRDRFAFGGFDGSLDGVEARFGAAPPLWPHGRARHEDLGLGGARRERAQAPVFGPRYGRDGAAGRRKGRALWGRVPSRSAEKWHRAVGLIARRHRSRLTYSPPPLPPRLSGAAWAVLLIRAAVSSRSSGG